MTASERLRQGSDRIVKEFRNEVVRAIPAMKGESRAVLTDSLPQFLELLAEKLERPDEDFLKKLEAIGRVHAAQRFALAGYTLEQVLTEYRILRRLICACAFGGGPIVLPEMEAVHDAIDRAVAQSGAHFLEISNRKLHEAKEEAQQALLALHAHIDSAPYGIALLDSQLRYVRVNKPLAELNGLKPEDHIGESVREALHSEADRLEPLLSKILRFGEPLLNQEMKIRPPGHPEKEHSLLFNYYPVKGGSGEVTGVGVIVVDVSELREAAATIELQARTMDTILSALPDLVFLIDRERRITYANAALLKLWGKTREEARGKNLKELGYPKHLVELHESQMDDVFRTKAGIKDENEFTKADGTVSYFENVFVPVIGSDGEVKFIAGAGRDITLRRKAEEELRRAVLNREEVLAVVSHDLRNPLGSILMTAAMLKRMPERDGAFVQEQILRIQRAGERMNDLIEDLLNLAKIEAGSFSLSTREICGCNVVLEAVEMIRSRADEKRIRIETRGTEQPLQMSCDHGMVLRVFSNLIGNAIKFTPEYGLIVVSAEDLGDEVRFCVRDTGPGIAEHHVSQIFDRFWQAKKTAHLGTGLGLAIAKGIVEAHGGRIWVESVFGRGASFYFTLPKAARGRRVA